MMNWTGRQRPTWLLALLMTSVVALAAGCADDVQQNEEEPEGSAWELGPWQFQEPDPIVEPDMPDDMSPDEPDMTPPPILDMDTEPDIAPPVPDMQRGDDIGAACRTDSTCESDLCLDDEQWPDGYCSMGCDPGDCEDQNGYCGLVLGGQSICVKPCERQSDCRDGYECRPELASDQTVCLPEVPMPPVGEADGEACQSDADCGGGTCIPEADGWPAGYCTTIQCQDRNDCYSPNGEDNRCYQNQQGPNLCVRICQQSSECRTDYVCQPVGGGVGFCVPDPSQPITEDFATYPFTITCEVPMGNTHTVNYDIDPTTSAYMVTSIARDSRDLYPNAAALPSGNAINYRGTNSFQLTTTEIFGWLAPLITPATPELAGQLEAGIHSLDMQTDSGEICTYVLQESTPGTTIDLNIYFVGVPNINAGNAANNMNIQNVLAAFNTIYTPAGVTVGTVRYYDITGADATAYQIIRSEDDLANLVQLSTRPGTTYDDALSMNIFFTRSFAMQGGAIGTSLGLPGPAAIHGTAASGVVFTSEFMGQTFQDQDGSIVDGDQYTGIVLAHEVGHYLGLFHTTESFGRGEDPLTDTPRCRGRDFPDSCPDLDNLMFPFAGVTHTTVTADQAFVIKANPLTKD